MPERLECEVLQKARYINTLTFTFYLFIDLQSAHLRRVVLSVAVNTRSSMSSVGSAGRDREVTAPVDVVGGHHQPDDDDDDAVVAVDKGSRSVSRSSRHSGHASDDADDRSRASYSVRFAPVSSAVIALTATIRQFICS